MPGRWRSIGTNHFGSKVWANPRKCSNGIYLSITGTGASCVIEEAMKD
jgi:hypothetical protein